MDANDLRLLGQAGGDQLSHALAGLGRFEELEVAPTGVPYGWVYRFGLRREAHELLLGTVRHLARLAICHSQAVQCAWAGVPCRQTEGADFLREFRVTFLER